MDLVSVIIITYNRFNFLLHALKSVYAQTYKNYEVIIINDGSTEEEYYSHTFPEKVSIYHRKDNSKKVFGYANLGFLRNFGVSKATGKYIAFLDDDDYWMPDKLKVQVNLMKTHQLSFCCSNGWIDNRGWKVNSDNKSQYGGMYDPHKTYDLVYDYPKLYQKRYNLNFTINQGDIFVITPKLQSRGSSLIICSSVIIDKDLYNNVDGFDENPPKGEDARTWKKVLTQSNCLLINLPLIYYDIGHGNGRLWR
jgi:glycosyltransferase involved in cell wall biosynthesis